MGNWKGVIRPLGGQSVELYDLRTDLGETTDVAAQHPDVVKKILGIASGRPCAVTLVEEFPNWPDPLGKPSEQAIFGFKRAGEM